MTIKVSLVQISEAMMLKMICSYFSTKRVFSWSLVLALTGFGFYLQLSTASAQVGEVILEDSDGRNAEEEECPQEALDLITKHYATTDSTPTPEDCEEFEKSQTSGETGMAKFGLGGVVKCIKRICGFEPPPKKQPDPPGRPGQPRPPKPEPPTKPKPPELVKMCRVPEECSNAKNKCINKGWTLGSDGKPTDAQKDKCAALAQKVGWCIAQLTAQMAAGCDHVVKGGLKIPIKQYLQSYGVAETNCSRCALGIE